MIWGDAWSFPPGSKLFDFPNKSVECFILDKKQNGSVCAEQCTTKARKGNGRKVQQRKEGKNGDSSI
jgi:hypothetical protein